MRLASAVPFEGCWSYAVPRGSHVATGGVDGDLDLKPKTLIKSRRFYVRCRRSAGRFAWVSEFLDSNMSARTGFGRKSSVCEHPHQGCKQCISIRTLSAPESASLPVCTSNFQPLRCSYTESPGKETRPAIFEDEAPELQTAASEEIQRWPRSDDRRCKPMPATSEPAVNLPCFSALQRCAPPGMPFAMR